MSEHSSSIALAPEIRMDANRQHMGFFGPCRQHPVGDNPVARREYPAFISSTLAIGKDAFGPWILERQILAFHHQVEITRPHGSQKYIYGI
jgi:hypothetical protein